MEITTKKNNTLYEYQIENEHLKEEIIKYKFENTELTSEINRFQSFKPYRLRNIIKEEGISIRNIIKIVYLVSAMLVPEGIRKYIRPFLHRFRKIFNIIFSDSYKYEETVWDSNLPLISVVITCFNYGNYINEALDSVLNQTFEDYEIIIVDGGSTDNGYTKSILNKIKNAKTKVFYRTESHLAGDNRNFGIKNALGKYICCLDADDKLDSTYFEKALHILENEKYDIVSPSVKEFGDRDIEYILPRKTNLSEIIIYNTISTVALFRKDLFTKNGGYFDYGKGESHVPEDWDFWVKQVANGARVFNLLDPLMNYRVHGNSLSRNRNNPALVNQRDKILRRNASKINNYTKIRSQKNNLKNYYATNPNENLTRSYNKFIKNQNEFLVVIPYTVLGGADNVTLSLISLLEKLGFTVSVITTVPFDKNLYVDTSSNYRNFTNKMFRLPLMFDKEETYSSFIISYIKLRKIKNVIVIGSTLFYSTLPSLKEEVPGIKVFDLQFNTDVHLQSNKKHRNLIDVTVAENSEIYKLILEEDKENHKKVVLINNGIDTKLFSPETKLLYNRGSEYTDMDFIVTFLGRLSPEKGPDLFIDIAKEVIDQDPLIKFILAGPGSMFDECYMKIKKLHLESNITMPGKVNGIEYLSISDVIVVPSKLDGRPLSIMESLSMGTPVIASIVGGIPEMIIDNQTGILCEKYNVKEFAKAIIKLKNNKDMIKSMSIKAREFAIKNFSRDIAEKKYKQIFIN